MNLGWTPDALRDFEQRIAERFNAAEIPYPVHLTGGNEEALLSIFEEVERHDWVLGSWRAHYHALLKGVSPEALEDAIVAGHSIALSFPKEQVLCSAIAGGMIPAAVGIGMAIRRSDGPERVWCFVGDMMACSGIFWESMTYASNHRLPVTWVVEDNGISVVTETYRAWGGSFSYEGMPNVRRYTYDLPWPHAGAGKRVEF